MSDTPVRPLEKGYDGAASMAPFTESELWRFFHESPHATSKHLLTLYSLAIGINAQSIVELGLGVTTRALRLAATKTGGILSSCDCDIQRFSHLQQQADQHWRLFLGSSEKFLSSLPGPFDLVLHDAAHDYYQVKMDLDLIMPRMRTFGIICVHDVQQTDLALPMLAAIRDATRSWQVSATVVPFNAGLAIIRIEKGQHPALTARGGYLPDGRMDTVLRPFPCALASETDAGAKSSLAYWVRWKLRRLLFGWR